MNAEEMENKDMLFFFPLSLLLRKAISKILINQLVLILLYDWILRFSFWEYSRSESAHAEIKENVSCSFNGRRLVALFYIVVLFLTSLDFLHIR